MSEQVEISVTRRFEGPNAPTNGVAQVVLEVPHGATTQAHLDAVKRMGVKAPEDWDVIYWCSTDQGAPELAERAAALLVDPEWVAAHVGPQAAEAASTRAVELIRGQIPRHYIDLNRVWIDASEAERSGLTPIVPAFLQDQAGPLMELRMLYDAYQASVTRALDATCRAGGLAMQVHTYSPRSVGLSGAGLTGATLRDAWSEAGRERWPLRPLGQLITAREGGPSLADEALVALMLQTFAEDADLELSVNAPFSFHPVTTLDAWAHRWPGQVLAIEIGRELLAEQYDPLGPWTPDAAVVDRLAGAMARAIAAHLA